MRDENPRVQQEQDSRKIPWYQKLLEREKKKIFKVQKENYCADPRESSQSPRGPEQLNINTLLQYNNSPSDNNNGEMSEMKRIADTKWWLVRWKIATALKSQPVQTKTPLTPFRAADLSFSGTLPRIFQRDRPALRQWRLCHVCTRCMYGLCFLSTIVSGQMRRT